ncbi:MAG: redoxin family protein [Sulfurimonas sp.]|nr:redoxin family protein [Sulfurimonas sp.]MDD3059883.1 redoxin family protein [Sulfurimonas sp.]MDD5203039.1 redoxin family protein [Sulfurimonas sp.]
MKEKILHYTKEIVLFIIVMTIFANIISIYKSSDLPKTPLHLDTVMLIDGKNYTLPKEKPLLVHIWATWCPTCKLEADNIQRISEHYEVLTIAVKSGTDEVVSRYLQERGFDFHVINDKDAEISKAFNIAAFPTTFIYDKEKNMLFSDVGYTSTLGLYLKMWWADL